MKKEITIVMTANDAWFEGVFLSALSIVRRTKNICHFYILSGDFRKISPTYKCFSSKHANIINNLVKKFNKKNSFELIDCTELFHQECKGIKPLKRWKGWYPYALFKLLIHRILILKGKVIVMDADVMACGDINKLFSIKIKDPFEMAAATDLLRWNFHHNFFKKHINVGVLLINLDKIRENKSFEKAISYIRRHKPLIIEQAAINRCCKIMTFGKKGYIFNYLKKDLKDDVILKHFLRVWKVRQWEIDKVHNILKLHNWDEDYKIFLREKKKW